ncbi:MAG: Fe-S protein assembly chaperone HscA [Acidimicrobiia bacterium]|nr:Fe-S protein assembly chaperone HscA [Acidimicrobiia bacterium]
MARVVGIDLGTTNSLVAYVDQGRPVVIRDKSGEGLVPSIVSIAVDGTAYVGREAQRRLLTEPERTVYSVKRFMGRGIDDVVGEAALLPFRVSGDAGGVVKIGVGEKELTPPEISALVLRELVRRAEEFFATLGEVDPDVSGAVITVPAYFNDAQRTATRDAGRIAGLEVLRIINEPTAASLAYGLDKRHAGLIAVYDFGGGTFDISILLVEDGVFQVLATNGDTHLGGDDIDRIFTQIVLDTLEQNGAVIHRNGAYDAELVQAIRRSVIQAKHDLSERDESDIRVDGFEVTADGRIQRAVGRQYRMALTRAGFERAIAPIIERTLAPCRQALADAGLEPEQIDEVVMVGGSTRIPAVRARVGELFGRTPHTELNPDEVVALGAAVQADILTTGNREMLLLDVTPLSLGIETMGGVTTKIILRNSTIPASGSEMFTTAVDDQTAVDIHVVQGERELVGDNRSLARFKLRGIPPMPAGLPRVQVQFQIDANGILSVTASELRTQVEQTIEVKPSYGLTDDEVERMLVDSFEHAEADFAARLLIEAKNEAESVVTATEKSLRASEFAEVATELAPGEQRRIEQALAGLKHVLTSEDKAAIEQWTQALNDATKHLAELMMNRSIRVALAGKNVDDVR